MELNEVSVQLDAAEEFRRALCSLSYSAGFSGLLGAEDGLFVLVLPALLKTDCVRGAGCCCRVQTRVAQIVLRRWVLKVIRS